MADLANIAAATAAGYKEVVSQKGSLWQVQLCKPLSGGASEDGIEHRAYGESTVSQAAAETNCLAALNVQRADRSGKKDSSGNGRTIDSK